MDKSAAALLAAAALALSSCGALTPPPPHLVTYHRDGKEVFRVEIQPGGNSSIISGASGMIGAALAPLLGFLGL